MLRWYRATDRLGTPRSYHLNPGKSAILLPPGVSPTSIDVRRWGITLADGSIVCPKLCCEGAAPSPGLHCGPYELLGAGIGVPTGVTALVAARVNRALKLLGEIAELPDPQVALLLRHCAAFPIMAHTFRTTPFSAF